MAYIDFLPLAEVKNHLRIDASFTDDDSALTRMVGSALQYIEMHTGHIFGERTKTYRRNVYGFIDIIDYPVTYTGDLVRMDYAGKVRFDADELTLNVGYASRSLVPDGLIEAALMMIDAWYYSEDKRSDITQIPMGAWQIIHTYKRNV